MTGEITKTTPTEQYFLDVLATELQRTREERRIKVQTLIENMNLLDDITLEAAEISIRARIEVSDHLEPFEKPRGAGWLKFLTEGVYYSGGDVEKALTSTGEFFGSQQFYAAATELNIKAGYNNYTGTDARSSFVNGALAFLFSEVAVARPKSPAYEEYSRYLQPNGMLRTYDPRGYFRFVPSQVVFHRSIIENHLEELYAGKTTSHGQIDATLCQVVTGDLEQAAQFLSPQSRRRLFAS